MSKLLNSRQIGIHPFKNSKQQRQAIVDRWKDSGLFEELTGGELELYHIPNGDPIAYHDRWYENSLRNNNLFVAEFNLSELIKLITLSIIKKHCK